MTYKLLMLVPLMVFSMSSGSLLGLDADQDSEKYDGMVILQVADMDDAIYTKLQEAVSGDPNTSLEYVCVESGIVVVKFTNSNMAENADNEIMVRGKFKGCAPSSKIKTIFVDAHIRTGISKC